MLHRSIIKPNHMQIPWHDPIRDQKELPVSQAPLPIRAGVVGRVGLLLLSCGTGAWRVRSSMNELAEALGLVCAADIGLLSIEYTCSDGENSFSQTLTLTATGVNTAKLDQLERFVKRFPLDGVYMTADDLHTKLDKIAQTGGSYTPLQLGLAAALACGAFTFLLGGGPIEMLLAFLGAGVGQYIRVRLTQRHLTLFGCIALSVAAACLVYAGLFRLASLLFPIDPQHQAGYICAMLFIIPGFPFITSGIDMAKQDMRSGFERLAYAIMIVVVATLTAWLMALLLRLAMSFCGVFGFSLMFNSPVKLASVAAVIGALTARRTGYLTVLAAVLVGDLILYAVGVPYMYLILHVYMQSAKTFPALLAAMLVYVPGDTLKIVVVTALVPVLRRTLAKAVPNL